jgi:hypothetical protein
MAAIFPRPTTRRFSKRSAARFFWLVDAIGRLHEPTPTQLEALASSYRSTGAYLAACPEFKGLLDEIQPHGSRELGTLVRPLDPDREGFDVDLVASLLAHALKKYGGSDGAVRLLNDLHAAAQRYAFAYGLTVRRSERCVTLEYAGGMTADIAPVIQQPSYVALYGDTCGRIPDRKLQLYDITNPRGYAKYFSAAAAISPSFTSAVEFKEFYKTNDRATVVPLSDADEVFPRLLSRLVQLMKLHRNVSFGKPTVAADAAPSSIFLTTLALEAYKDLAPQPHDSPLELMLDILQALPRYFRIEYRGANQHWMVDNPTAPGDNLASGMNTKVRQDAFWLWHVRALQDVEAIIEAIEQQSGMDALLGRVESAFGVRAARAVRDDQLQSQTASRSAGRAVLLTGTGASASTAVGANTFFGA